MNKLNLVGVICKDIEVKQSQGGKSVARFSVAAQRKFKNAQGKYDSDFIPCVAFEQTADFISKYFKKGDRIGIVGRMQSGSYEGKNGKVYTLDCYVEEAEFAGSKGSNNSQPTNINQNNGFNNAPLGIDSELPFN